MAIGKDIDRQVRAFLKQHLDLEYIRFYLQDTYQLDAAATDEVLERLGAFKGSKSKSKTGGHAAQPGKPDGGGVKKTSFY
jgi:hypothetical protein